MIESRSRMMEEMVDMPHYQATRQDELEDRLDERKDSSGRTTRSICRGDSSRPLRIIWAFWLPIRRILHLYETRSPVESLRPPDGLDTYSPS